MINIADLSPHALGLALLAASDDDFADTWPRLTQEQQGAIPDAQRRACFTPRRIDLSNLRDVRLELAAVYRKMDAGEIESQEGTRRAYVLKTIHDVIVSGEIERRIEELEKLQSLPPQHPRPQDARRLN